jgi:hypothetical protein
MVIERPDIVENKYLKYLDNLKDSGSINMYDAPRMLGIDFDLSNREAKTIVRYWIDSYTERHV